VLTSNKFPELKITRASRKAFRKRNSFSCFAENRRRELDIAAGVHDEGQQLNATGDVSDRFVADRSLLAHWENKLIFNKNFAPFRFGTLFCLEGTHCGKVLGRMGGSFLIEIMWSSKIVFQFSCISGDDALRLSHDKALAAIKRLMIVRLMNASANLMPNRAPADG
jgi:hypothetical protein